MNKKWNIKKINVIEATKLSDELGVSLIIAKLLVSRGIKTYEQARKFFRPELSNLNDPFLMKNMSVAVERLQIAIFKKQNVLVYGDYDVDGTTAVAMMYSFLRKFSSKIYYYTPCRYTEGYGLSYKGVDYALQKGCDLIITLDCGITAIKQIQYANNYNLDIIVCDHHEPLRDLPKAYAILNPKQKECNYPFKELTGCGVGFKLIQAYCYKNNISFDEIREYLDLLVVSIGADIVPMIGENRVLAFYGLKQINSSPRAGFKALLQQANKKKILNMSDLVFGIAPRINAAGRIDHANKAVGILIETDYKRATTLAIQIEENNKERKSLDVEITEEALSMIDKNKKSTVVFNEKWHKGVVGIVASRLIETYYKPTIVFAEKDGVLTGSARSVHNFDLYHAISKCSHLCEEFGGHKYAAGLSIKKENLDQFIKQFEQVVSNSIAKEQLQPKVDIEMEIAIDDINPKLYRIIKQFAPFGPLNPSPQFVTRSVSDSGYIRKIGVDQAHLKFNIKSSNASISCIGFGLAKYYEKIKSPQEIDICYTINENEWNNKKELQLLVTDIK